jgi:hypothetical protein
MYRVRSPGQGDHGPVTAEVLMKWRDEGRITAETLVQAEGTAAWVPVSAVAGFGGSPPVPAPPILPPPALPPPLPVARLTPPSNVCGLAIASFILGGLGLVTVGITSVPGLVLGIVGLRKIRKSQGKIHGGGLAIGGICVSAATFLLLPLVLALTIPAINRSRAQTRNNQCLDNMKQIALCLHVAASENGEKLPQANRWCDAIAQQIPDPGVFACPRAGRQRCGYGFNARLSGVDITKARGDAVMLFESKDGWNLSGSRAEMLSRHGEVYHVALLDGSARQVAASELSKLRWDP